MPYIVTKGSGSKPYKIVNQKTREVVGSSDSLAKAHRSIGYRMDAEAAPKTIKKFKRTVSNSMRSFGEVDMKKRTVRINKVKHRGSPGELLDTIVHEKSHIAHPKMKEKNIRKHTARLIHKMSRQNKQKHYKLFRS